MGLHISELDDEDLDEQIQVSADGSTVWVFGMDGSTVGRFSKVFGLDVHTTITQQLAGGHQCIHCTHQAAGADDWTRFIELMREHHQVEVPADLVTFAMSQRERMQ